MMQDGLVAVRRWRAAGAILVVLVFGGAFAPLASGVVYYVRAGVTSGDGLSWATAKGYLQQGLDAAQSGDEVWVAAGTYTPTSYHGLTGGSRVVHWRLKNGVAVYGGFAATGEPVWADRDPDTHETILSGDLTGNDNPETTTENLAADSTRSENAYHLFYHPLGLNLNSTAVLDGFTLRGGNANATLYPHNTGGGMRNYTDNSPTIQNCRFEANTASAAGGAMFNFTSNAIMNYCTFTGNVASSETAKGGAVYNVYGLPVFISCSFEDNHAVSGGAVYNQDSGAKASYCTFDANAATSGGGWYNEKSSGAVSDCVFSENTATGLGGAMRNFDQSSPKITRCTFTENTAKSGGAMYNFYQCQPVISHCEFFRNVATLQAGGVYNANTAVTLRYCLFQSNTAASQGGGVREVDSSSTVTYCTFETNRAANGGGAAIATSATKLDHCLFEGNTAIERGGGIYGWEVGAARANFCTFTGGRAAEAATAVSAAEDPNTIFTLTLSHSICFNGGDEFARDEPNALLAVSYCAVQGGYEGQGNIDADPAFLTAGYWDDSGTPEEPDDDTWVSGDYRLQSAAGHWAEGTGYPGANFDREERVNLRDFVTFHQNWLAEAPGLEGDLNGDGRVDPNDVRVFAQQFLSPGPSTWTADATTSPCIDSGNPGAKIITEGVGDGNIRLNMGIYGGTCQASKPPAGWSLLADLNNDGTVDSIDLADWASGFLKKAADLPEDLSRDGYIDLFDWAILAGDWLETTDWFDD